MSTAYFRSAPIYGTTPSTDKSPVDREAGIIYGASAMQAGEASGKGVMIDEATLKQVAEMGNAMPNGSKVRFTHPGMCSDGLGKTIGRMKNFSVQGDKVVGDIHLNKSSGHTPDGDLRTYVLDLAEEDPESFGMSVAIEPDAAWKLDSGAEVKTRERPANAVGDLPFLRLKKLRAVDVVDEPAANRDGLFSGAFAGTSSEDAAQAFSDLDAFRESRGMTLAAAHEFCERYFTARGLSFSITTADFSAPKKESHMKPEELKALKAKHPEHAGLIVDMFADGKPESEILGAIKDAQFAALEKSVKDMQLTAEKADADHKAALAAKDEQFAKSQTELAEAKKQTAFALNAGKDPGADASAQADGDALKKEWEAMSAAKKVGFFNQFEVFAEARAFEIKDRLMAGKGE
jgi:hypothetical protein